MAAVTSQQAPEATHGSAPRILYRARLGALLPAGSAVRGSLAFALPGRQVHVVAAEEPLATMTAAEYAAAHHDAQAPHLPDFRVLRPDAVYRTPDMIDGVTRTVSWTTPGGEGIVQTQVFWVLAGRGLSAVATVTADRADELLDDVDAALRSVTALSYAPAPISPAAPGDAGPTATGDFDAGQTGLDRAALPGGDAKPAGSALFSLEELTAIAGLAGVDGFPGAPAYGPEGGAAALVAGLRAARRSLRMRRLVTLGPGGARLDPQVAGLVRVPVEADLMITAETSAGSLAGKVVWFGAAEDVVRLSAPDSGCVLIETSSVPEAVRQVELLAGDRSAPTGTQYRVAWLRRVEGRFVGADVTWTAGDRLDPAEPVRRLRQGLDAST